MGAGWHPQEGETSRCLGWHWPSLQHDEWANKGPLFPTASPQRPWLHHWMWGARGHWRKRRGYSQRHPHAQPLHSQEGGPGLGAQCLGFRPSLDFNLLSEEGDPPNLCGPRFPPRCYTWRPSLLRCPSPAICPLSYPPQLHPTFY